MLRDLIDALLAAVFVVAALAKAARPGAAAAGLRTFGVPEGRVALVLVGALVCLELVLAAGIAAGLDLAAWAGSAVVLAFALVSARALRGGAGGEPCACFGPSSRLTRWSVVRNLLLAVVLALVPVLAGAGLTAQDWLAVGLGVALLGVVALGVAVAALAREVGVLRRELVPAPALEVPEEGPPLLARAPLIERFALSSESTWALAVFSSEGCRMCQVLEPAVRALAREPVVDVEVFDEHRDALVWRVHRVPGSPFAVAMDRAGTVMAKGTFNSAAQLEGILAEAERRTRAAANG